MDPPLSISQSLVQDLAMAVASTGSGLPKNSSAGDWVPQGAANSIWSIGKLGLKATDSAVQALLDALSEKLLALLKSNSAAPPLPPPGLSSQTLSSRPSANTLMPQHLSNSLHGMATAGYFPALELFELFCSCSNGMLDKFSPQEMTNLVWSMAALSKIMSLKKEPGTYSLSAGLPPCGWTLLQNIADTFPVLLQDSRWRAGMRSQTLSNIAWGYATLKLKPQRLFAELAGVASQCNLLHQFKPQELANLQYAFALADYYPGAGLMDDMAERTAGIAGRMRPEELSTSIWAWGTLRYLPTAGVMERMLRCASDSVERFRSQEIGNVIWALGRLAWMPGSIFANQVKEQVGSSPIWDTCAVQDATNFLWGLCVLDSLDVLTMNRLCSKLMERFLPSEFAAENCVQLFIAHQQLQQSNRLEFQNGSNSVDKADERSFEYLRIAGDVLRRGEEENSRQLKKVHVSITQSDVANTLRNVGFDCELEYIAAEDIPAVDVAVLSQQHDENMNGRPIAVEVDGASHFTVNAPHAPLGKSILRWKALEKCGWKVVSVPYYSWNILSTQVRKKNHN